MNVLHVNGVYSHIRHIYVISHYIYTCAHMFMKHTMLCCVESGFVQISMLFQYEKHGTLSLDHTLSLDVGLDMIQVFVNINKHAKYLYVCMHTERKRGP